MCVCVYDLRVFSRPIGNSVLMNQGYHLLYFPTCRFLIVLACLILSVLSTIDQYQSLSQTTLFWVVSVPLTWDEHFLVYKLKMKSGTLGQPCWCFGGFLVRFAHSSGLLRASSNLPSSSKHVPRMINCSSAGLSGSAAWMPCLISWPLGEVRTPPWPWAGGGHSWNRSWMSDTC